MASDIKNKAKYQSEGRTFVDYAEGAYFWDGMDVLYGNPLGKGTAFLNPAEHLRHKAELPLKGITDPDDIAADFYTRTSEFLTLKIQQGAMVKPSFQQRLDTLQSLITVASNANPLYKVTAAYGLSVFYKKLNL